MMSSFVNRIRRRNLLVYTIAGVLVIAAFAIGLTVGHGSAPANNDASAGDQAAGNHGGNSGDPGAGRSGPAGQCAASQILHSPFNYDGAAGSYSSGRAGLPTYGTPGSDFPHDTAGVILPTGTK